MSEQWTWRTAKDDRVCPTCSERDEMQFHRDTPLAYPPHPFCESEDGCRCVADQIPTAEDLTAYPQ